MKIIKINDKDYPKKLLNIYDSPKKLYVLGNEKILNDFAIGIVGTRYATLYGKEITKSLAYGLAKRGIAIVSGMARGIDTSAHTGAILANGKTIAVLGGGFNNIYPKENIELFNKNIPPTEIRRGKNYSERLGDKEKSNVKSGF